SPEPPTASSGEMASPSMPAGVSQYSVAQTPDTNPPTASYDDTDQLAQPRPVSGLFGPYELLDELGHCGMGVVLRARHTVLNRIVGLQTLGPGLADHADESVRRFCREARAVSQLRHPNIIPIYEFDQHDGQYFFALAFASGGSWTVTLSPSGL